MEEIVALLLRKGVVPICSSGASFCFALYSAKLSRAADLWEAALVQPSSIAAAADGSIGEQENLKTAPLVQRYYIESAAFHALHLREHSGTCLVLSLSSAAIAREGYLDWQHYGSASQWEDLAAKLWRLQRPFPFFMRPSVIFVSGVSFLASRRLNGDWRFWKPESPMHYSKA